VDPSAGGNTALTVPLNDKVYHNEEHWRQRSFEMTKEEDQ
jgi:hypothetical protein